VGGQTVKRWRVKVTRAMLDCTPGGSDYAPDKGWYR